MNKQGGEITISGVGSVEIELSEHYASAFVQFTDEQCLPTCAPVSHDTLSWRLHRGWKDLLIIEWSVSNQREIEWAVR
jgi:hypothetical protein